MRMVHIKQIVKGGTTEHLQSLATATLPPLIHYPQYTPDELSKGKPVSFDDVERKKRVRAGILTYASLNYCSLFTNRNGADKAYL